MYLHKFLYLTYNSDALIQYFVNKQVIHGSIQCSKCENINYINVYENFILHCNKRYVSTVTKLWTKNVDKKRLDNMEF